MLATVRNQGEGSPTWLYRRKEAALRAALRLDPDYEEANLRLGNVMIGREKPDEGARELGWVAAKAAEGRRRFVAELLLGSLHERRGRLGEAIAHFRQALAVQPASQAARVALSQALFQSGAQEEAVEVMQPVLSADRRAVDEWLEYRLSAERRAEEALDQLRAAAAR